MKNILYLFLILILILIGIVDVNSKNFLYKEGRFNIYYPEKFNMQTLEYIAQLLNYYQEEYDQKFIFSSSNKLSVFLFQDAINFQYKTKSHPWERLVKRNRQFFCLSSDIRSKDKIIQKYLKYFVFYENFKEQQGHKIPEWMINGLSIFYSHHDLFEKNRMKFNDQLKIEKILVDYQTREEYIQANYYCLKAIQYFITHYNEEILLKFISSFYNRKQFKIKFFNHFGMKYSDYIIEVLE